MTVSLNIALADAATDDYATNSLTAIAGSDFSSASGTLSFAPGELNKTFSIVILDDQLLEGDEEFAVQLSNPVNAQVGLVDANVTIIDGEPETFENVRLVRDTGHDWFDLVTVDPRIEGIVNGDFGDSTLSIDFDHNADGVADGSYTDLVADRSFLYDPTQSEPGYVDQLGDRTIHYRLVLTAPSGDQTHLAWIPFEFELEAIPTSLLVIEELEFHTELTDESTGVTSSTGVYLTGQVAGPDSSNRFGADEDSESECSDGNQASFGEGFESAQAESAFGSSQFDAGCGFGNRSGSTPGDQIPGQSKPITIEFDLDGDGEPDQEGHTDGLRKFVEELPDMNEASVSVRAMEWSVEYGAYLAGQWEQIELALPGIDGPSVESASFLPAGNNAILGFYSDVPVLRGQFATDGFGLIEVEVDLDGDNNVDLVVSADESGVFTVFMDDLTDGEHTVRVRGKAWNDGERKVGTGEWKPVVFTNDPSSMATIETFGILLNRATDDESQPETSLPAMKGKLTDGDGKSVNVMIDIDGDSVADATVEVGAGNEFYFHSDDLVPGSQQISVWTESIVNDGETPEVSTSQNLTFTLTEPDSAGQAISIGLAEDTGEADDSVTSNARITGHLTGMDDVSNQIIQWDSDGDFIPDGQTSTSATGEYGFVPTLSDLGSKTIFVRSIVTNVDSNTPVESDWIGTTFTLVAAEYESSSDQSTPIDEGNDEDDYASGESTSEDYSVLISQLSQTQKIEGHVSGLQSGEVLIVEIDTDGDDIADVSKVLTKDGDFVMELGVEIVLTADAVSRFKVIQSNGKIIDSTWTTVPDNGSGDDGGNDDPTESVSDPEQTANESQYADALNSAHSDRAEALATADQEYADELAQAEADFLAAQDAANAAYQSALASYSGDLTTLDIQPIDLTVGNPLAFVNLPDDSTQPTPPRENPTYDGPQYQFSEDGDFQSAKTAAENTFRDAESQAKQIRRQKDRQAREEFEEAVRQQREADNAAREELENGLGGGGAGDGSSGEENDPEETLRAATEAYNEGMQAAYEAFSQVVRAAWEARKEAVEAAAETLADELRSSRETYNDEVAAAAEAYHAILNRDPGPSYEERIQARIDYDQAVLDASKEWGLRNAQSNYDYQIAVIEANRVYAVAYTEASKALADTTRGIRKTYEYALADYAKAMADQQNEDDAARSSGLGDIARDSAIAIAEARKVYDYALAANEHEERIALGQAKTQRVVDLAEAKRDALDGWDESADTPWTAFQLAKAENEWVLANALKTAGNTHTEAIADAELERAKAEADADYDLTVALAERDHNANSANTTAQKNRRSAIAQAIATAAKETADARAILDEAMTNASYDLSIAAIESHATYATAVADANLAYSQVMISARRLYKGVRPSTAAGAWSSYAQAINNAYKDWATDSINQWADYGTAARAAWAEYSEELVHIDARLRKAILAANQAHKDETAAAATDKTIEHAQAIADHRKALNAATLVYVMAVAPKNKEYYDQEIVVYASQSVDDAESFKQFYQDEANQYLVAINAWNDQENSPWTQYHATLAGIEFAWAVDVGAAELQHAQDMRGNSTSRQNALSSLSSGQRVAVAQARRTRDDALADHRFNFVKDIAEAQEDSSAGKSAGSQSAGEDSIDREVVRKVEEIQFAKDHADQAAAAEKTYQLAMLDARTAYSNASIAASAEMHGTIGDSYEDVIYGEFETYEEETAAWDEHQETINEAVAAYNEAMQTATDDYNTAGQAATDALREARKELFVSWIKHHAKNRYKQSQADESETAADEAGDHAQSDRELAQAIYDATVTFVTDRRESLDTYSTTVNNLDPSASAVRTATYNAYRYHSASAANDFELAMYIADAAKREDDVSARGYYEVAWYTRLATQQSALVGSGNLLAGPAADAANAEADFANAIRIARDTYEDTISMAGLARLTGKHNAQMDRISEENLADLTYDSTVSSAQATHWIALDHAANAMAAQKTIAEAKYDKEKMIADADLAAAIANAAAERDRAKADADDDHADGLGEAYRVFYENEVDYPSWSNLVWHDINPDSYSYYGIGWGYYGGYFGGYYFGGYGGYGFGYGIGYGFGGWGYGGYYGGYGYWGLGYGYGYGFGWAGGLGWGWGGYGFGYGVGYFSSNTSSENAEALGEASSEAGDQRDQAEEDADVAYAEAVGVARVTHATTVGNALMAMSEEKGQANVTYVTTASTADETLSSVESPASESHAQSISFAEETLANSFQHLDELHVVQTVNAEVGFYGNQSLAIEAKAASIAGAEIDVLVAVATEESNSLSAIAQNTADDADIQAAVEAEARLASLNAMRPGYVISSTLTAVADANFATALVVASGTQRIDDAEIESDFVQDRSQAERIRRINIDSVGSAFSDSSLLIENTRRQTSTQLQSDYHNAVAEAEAEKMLAAARATKDRDVEKAREESDDDMSGNSVDSDADKAFRKAIADAELAYATTIANKLKTLQTQDAQSKADFTVAAANLDFDYENNIASYEFVYHDTISSSGNSRDIAVADARRTYSIDEAYAQKSHRLALATGEAARISSVAAGTYAAYDHVDAHYSLPYTAYLLGLAAIKQAVEAEIADATTNLALNRNAADDLYYNVVIPARYDLDVASANAAESYYRDTATADRDSIVDHATARKTFQLNLATPANTFASSLATAEAAFTVELATAEKTLVHELADDVADANTNYSNAVNLANETWDTNQNSANVIWWAEEAAKQADLMIDEKTAQRDWYAKVLAAENVRIVDQNNAQQVFQNLETNAYHDSQTAWVGHDYTFYMAEITARAAQPSGLDDPWSARNDTLNQEQVDIYSDLAAASLARAETAITAQRDHELTIINSEIILRNQNSQSALGRYSQQANDRLQSVVDTANAHRNSGVEGSRPAQTTPQQRTPDTLSVATQISISMAPDAWTQMTDRVIDRTDDWIGDMYGQYPELGLELTQEIPNTQTIDAVPPDGVEGLRREGEFTGTSIQSRNLVPSVEGPSGSNESLSDSEPNGQPESTSVSAAMEDAQSITPEPMPIGDLLVQGGAFLVGFTKGFIVDGAGGTISGIADTGASIGRQTKAVYSIWSNWISKKLGLPQNSLDVSAAEDAKLAYRKLASTAAEIGRKYGPYAKALFIDLGEAWLHAQTAGMAGNLTPSAKTQEILQVTEQVVGKLLTIVEEELAAMSGKQRAALLGNIAGQITFEVALAAASTTMTAGAGSAVVLARLGKLTKVVDRLNVSPAVKARLLKAVGKFEDLAKRKSPDLPAKATIAPRAAERLDDWCFAPDTLVATENGRKQIVGIEPGERVYAFDFDRNEYVLSKVLQRHDNDYQGDFVTIALGNGEVIRVTENHPLWILDGEGLTSRPTPDHLDVSLDEGKAILGRWINSQAVRVGDKLYARNGIDVTVESVRIDFVDNQQVCNLTIKDFHTFLISEAELLVHNDSWCEILENVHGWTKPDALLLIAKQKGWETKWIHGHHIVMKGAKDTWSIQAQKILKDYDIPLLETQPKLRAASSDELHNMAMAFNRRYYEGRPAIHSPEYSQAVLERLEEAADSGNTYSERRENVIEALADMKSILEKGEIFW